MMYRTKTKKSTTARNNSKMEDRNRSKFKSWISGIGFCFFWYFSIVAGFFLLICPILPLVILKPKLYRKWSDIVFGMWEAYPVAMMEILLGVRIKMSGDRFNPFEGSLVIMNHRTRLDWNFLWAALFHCSQPHSHNMKFVLKAPIMHVPGPGWVMQACSFMFIHRNWQRDQELLSEVLEYLKEVGQTSQILIFPEGTDLSPKNVERSHKFADEKGLERYHRVLHPKTTGFAFLAQKMRLNGQLQAVYDFTVAYPKTLPETEMDLLRGKFPEEIHFDIKRYDMLDLPVTEDDLKNWLSQLWWEKEHKLQKFYSHGSFVDVDITPDCLEQNSTNELLKKQSQISTAYGLNGVKPQGDKQGLINRGIHTAMKSSVPGCSLYEPSTGSRPYERYRPSNLLYLALLFWTTLVLIAVHAYFTSYTARMWVTVHFVIFILFSLTTKGFHHFVASCFRYLHPRGARNPIIKKLE